MNSIFLYFSERFPAQLVLLLSFSYSLMLLGVSSHLTGTAISLANVGLVALSFAAFLLRLRVTDEFKDIDHDSKNYPNRPFQRGAISSQQLISIGVISLIVELGSLYIIGPKAVIFYLPVLAYSLLTAKEFFISSWLNKHFTTYFISHQLIFVVFTAWGFMTFGVQLSPKALFGALAFVMTMSIFEIIRKLEYRHDTRGKIVKDSYPAVWGAPFTTALLILMALSVGAFLSVVTGDIWHMLLALVAVLFTYSGSFELIRAALGISLAIQGVLLLT